MGGVGGLPSFTELVVPGSVDRVTGFSISTGFARPVRNKRRAAFFFLFTPKLDVGRLGTSENRAMASVWLRTRRSTEGVATPTTPTPPPTTPTPPPTTTTAPPVDQPAPSALRPARRPDAAAGCRGFSGCSSLVQLSKR